MNLPYVPVLRGREEVGRIYCRPEKKKVFATVPINDNGYETFLGCFKTLVEAFVAIHDHVTTKNENSNA
jgi:hypothetical protein